MKYRIKDKVKIVNIGQSLYLNMTGKVVDKFGELIQVELDERKKEIDDFLWSWAGWVFVHDEQLIKIEKGLEIE